MDALVMCKTLPEIRHSELIRHGIVVTVIVGVVMKTIVQHMLMLDLVTEIRVMDHWLHLKQVLKYH